VLGNPQSPNPGCSEHRQQRRIRVRLSRRRAPLFSRRYDNIPQANGSQTVKLTDAGANTNGSGINTNGASLVVIYKFVTPGLPNIAPLRAGGDLQRAYTMNKRSAAMTQTVAGFYQALADDDARMTGIAGNGEKGFSSPLSVNGQTIDTDPFVGALGARWDNPGYTLNLPTNAASFSAMATANGETCVTWAAIVASTNVPDSDSDGPSRSVGDERITSQHGRFPATFGTCSDYPSGARA